MKIDTVRELLDAQVACCDELLDTEVFSACGSDMMSDVLAFVKDQAVLLTGLVNEQVIRTAAMMDMKCIVFVRGKLPTPEMVDFAAGNNIVVLTSGLRMYEACGLLYCGGLNTKGAADA